MLRKLADRLAVAKELARLAGFGVARNVGVDRVVQASEDNFNRVAIRATGLTRGADGVGREEVEMAANVEVLLADVSGGKL